MQSQARELYDMAARHALSLARGERHAELWGRRQRTFDPQGLHPFSVEVGRMMALAEFLEPKPTVDPVVIKLQGREQMDQEFRQEIRDGVDGGRDRK